MCLCCLLQGNRIQLLSIEERTKCYIKEEEDDDDDDVVVNGKVMLKEKESLANERVEVL